MDVDDGWCVVSQQDIFGTTADSLFADCHNVTDADISDISDDDDTDDSEKNNNAQQQRENNEPNNKRGPATCVATSETKEIVKRLTGLMNGTESAGNSTNIDRVRKGNKKKRRKNQTRR